jgi:hypothetical protein
VDIIQQQTQKANREIEILNLLKAWLRFGVCYKIFAKNLLAILTDVALGEWFSGNSHTAS